MKWAPVPFTRCQANRNQAVVVNTRRASGGEEALLERSTA